MGEFGDENDGPHSATEGDCSGLATGRSSSCRRAAVIGGSSGVDASFSRSIGSSTSGRVISMGEVRILASLPETFRVVGLVSLWSDVWNNELVKDDDRVDGGRDDVVICRPDSANFESCFRCVHRLVKDGNRSPSREEIGLAFESVDFRLLYDDLRELHAGSSPKNTCSRSYASQGRSITVDREVGSFSASL